MDSQKFAGSGLSAHVLAVNDLNKSKDFYVTKLGFEVDFEMQGWCFLERDGFRVRLGHCPEAVPIADCQDHSWFAYVDVPDAESRYNEYRNNGVEIWHELDSKPWGKTEFAIVTVDFHRIVFGQTHLA